MEGLRAGLGAKVFWILASIGLLFSLPLVAFPHGNTWSPDVVFTAWLHGHATPALTTIMKWISTAALHNAHYWIIAAAGLYFLVMRLRILPTLALLAVRLSAEPVGNWIKDAYARPRPQLAWLASQSKSFSYPSGTVVVGATFFVMLAYVFADEFENPRLRTAVQAVGWVFAGLIALSRVYLGAHWLSDTVAGLAVACAITAIASAGLSLSSTVSVPWLRPLTQAAASGLRRKRSRK